MRKIENSAYVCFFCEEECEARNNCCIRVNECVSLRERERERKRERERGRGR